MKVVILAGGFGTRISEETGLKPKPMVEIGDKPILWHIMKYYSSFGYNEFIICLGFKGYSIKEYFYNYFLHNCDVTFNVRDQEMEIHQNLVEPWKITLVDTGLNTMTGGRVKRIRQYVGNQTFMLTYGDGLSNVDLGALSDFHFAHKKLATITAVQPSGRWGLLNIDNSQRVESFKEKLEGDGGWVNGGFFVFNPGIFDYIEGDATVLEKEPLENLAKDGQLMSYKHSGFWQPMDTLREKKLLEELWQGGKAPWKVW